MKKKVVKPKTKIKKKSPLSIKEWIFCISGLTILTLLVVLPPVFRIVFADDKEKENMPVTTPVPTMDLQSNKKETEPIDDSKLEKIACTKIEVHENSYQEEITLILAYEDGGLQVYSDTNKKTYDLAVEDQLSLYQKGKLTCDDIPKSYLTISGFNYSCTSTENSIEIAEKFDLAVFKEKKVTVGEEEVILSSPYYPKQNVRLIRRELEKVGYTCDVLAPVVDTPSESQGEVQDGTETFLDTTQGNLENVE